VLCCQVEVSASGSSLFQRSPTECGVSECDREASRMRKPWPTRDYCALGGGGGACSKNWPAQMGTHYLNVGRTNRQKENWATKDQMGRHVQENSRRTVVTEQPKTGAKQVYSQNIRKTKVTNSAVYLVMQVPTYQAEVKLYYKLQVSTRHLQEQLTSDKTLEISLVLPGGC
jgi:hypothetical protein